MVVATWSVGNLIYNKTYGQWTADFWTWLTQLTQGSANGANCNQQQNDPDVFFLAGYLERDGRRGNPGGANRNCRSIPSNKAILAAPINKLSTSLENSGLARDQLQDQANSVINQVTDKVAIIDGDIVDLQRVYHSFTLDIRTTPNFFGNNPVNTDAATDGFWLFIKKSSEGGLSQGDHTLQIIGTGNDHDMSPFTSSVTYRINIA